jgi:glutamyl-tRNA reductase
MSSTTHIAAATFAYPAVESATRARLTTALRRPDGVGSTFVLDTCLRIEVVVAGGTDDLQAALDAAFGGSADVASAKLRYGADAVEHIYRVAAGLESPIRGEREILTQFRQTMTEATERGSVSGIFAKLLETAVSTGRQARELLSDHPHDSMAAVAAQTVGAAERVAVFGSGVMANAVIEALRGLPAPPQVTVVARTPERVTAPGVDVWPLEDAASALAEFPAVISATSAKQRLLDRDTLTRAIENRRAHLTLVDMAMPPDFDSPASDSVRYLDIDDLARMADRRARDDDADSVVHNAAAEAYHTYVDHHEVGPVIGSLTRHADGIVEAVVGRFGNRLSTAEDLAVLRQTAHTVARTLIAGPISYIRQPDRAPEAVDVVANAFGVDE